MVLLPDSGRMSVSKVEPERERERERKREESELQQITHPWRQQHSSAEKEKVSGDRYIFGRNIIAATGD